jgi:hypothetical protein
METVCIQVIPPGLYVLQLFVDHFFYFARNTQKISGAVVIIDNPLPPPEASWKPKCKRRNLIESRNSNGAVVVVLIASAIATDLT